jgi:hypothetical protein
LHQAAFDQAMARTAGCFDTSCDVRCFLILSQTGGGVS